MFDWSYPLFVFAPRDRDHALEWEASMRRAVEELRRHVTEGREVDHRYYMKNGATAGEVALYSLLLATNKIDLASRKKRAH